MASEIIVNTIKAPTTGANANKVIIPSGVTLDASAGTLRPSAGAVVQVKPFATTAQITSTATTSYVSLLIGSITTQYANSIIVVHGVAPFYSNNPNGNTWTNSAYIQLQENNTTVAGFEHPGPQPSMEFSNCVPILFNSGQKSVGTYTYAIQTRPTVGGDTHYFGRNTNGGGGNAYSYTRMTLMEIAQ